MVGKILRCTKVMATALNSFEIVGVHPVEPTEEQYQETLEIQCGSNLSGAQLERAKKEVNEHFAGLYLIVIEADPPGSEIDWSIVTQPIDGQPESNWQVPYGEQIVDQASGRWAFFLHFVNLNRPLRTPVGEKDLPDPTVCPEELKSIVYEVP